MSCAATTIVKFRLCLHLWKDTDSLQLVLVIRSYQQAIPDMGNH